MKTTVSSMPSFFEMQAALLSLLQSRMDFEVARAKDNKKIILGNGGV